MEQGVLLGRRGGICHTASGAERSFVSRVLMWFLSCVSPSRNDVTHGFICINTDQRKGTLCLDYEVRFTCPDSFCKGKHPTMALEYLLTCRCHCRWAMQRSLSSVFH